MMWGVLNRRPSFSANGEDELPPQYTPTADMSVLYEAVYDRGWFSPNRMSAGKTAGIELGARYALRQILPEYCRGYPACDIPAVQLAVAYQ